ncbi:hypothetical protein BDC45DRAFT_568366 [Circinella umbellata]|nr:hypothetical protein BDC45DRAFT_568366 [Circinella umbellata]
MYKWNTYDPSLTDNILKEKWIHFIDEVNFVPTTRNARPTINELKRQYAIELHKLYPLKLTGHIKRQQENVVADLEADLIAQQVITERRRQDSEELKVYFILANEHGLEKIKSHLKSIIVRRTVLIDQLSQNIELGNYKTSKRLKTSIQNVKRVATPVLDSYNGICHNIGRPEACIKYQEICNLQQIPLKHLTPMCLVELCRFLEELNIIKLEITTKIEERRLKQYTERKSAALEFCIRNQDVHKVVWKILPYHRLLDAELFYFKVHGRRTKVL